MSKTDVSEDESNEMIFSCLIEAAGERYLATQRLDFSYDFTWTESPA
jgi:hypothetical protein